ncbi:MAG: SCO family protein [Paracoccus sp. (in: a-proteobacteria)]|uniref:SCO family protein n=1 Tax=Paracoccus sp. TaxID=267 RepID=UPI0039E70193
MSLRLAALLLPFLCLPAPAHQGHVRAIPMQADRAEEHLALPDIPVTDSRSRSQGFVSRYGDAGPLLVSFIYTNCTEYCGLTISVMSILDQDLQAPGAPPLRMVAISVDPARDTPEVLAELARSVQASDRWDWVVASAPDTPALLAAFGLTPGPVEQHEPVYLLGDLRTGLFRRLPADAQPDEMLALARRMR